MSFLAMPTSLVIPSLSLVLSRAELTYRREATADEAISKALHDHPQTEPVARICRAAWRVMVDPNTPDEGVPAFVVDDDTGPTLRIVLPRVGETTDSTDGDPEPPPEVA